MTRGDFAARYMDILGKRFPVLDETEVTREQTRLIRHDCDALFTDAFEEGACPHDAGVEFNPTGGHWHCAMCRKRVCKECRVELRWAERRWNHPLNGCKTLEVAS